MSVGEWMLAISLIINFILLAVAITTKDQNERLKNTLDLAFSDRIFGGKTAWWQYNYILHSYVQLRKQLLEIETAYPAMKEEYKDTKKFSKDWSTVTRPKYGTDDIAKLTSEFNEAIEQKNGWTD